MCKDHVVCGAVLLGFRWFFVGKVLFRSDTGVSRESGELTLDILVNARCIHQPAAKYSQPVEVRLPEQGSSTS